VPGYSSKIDKNPLDNDIDLLTSGRHIVENGRFNSHDFRQLYALVV